MVDKRVNPVTNIPYDNIYLVGYFTGAIDLSSQSYNPSSTQFYTTPGGFIGKFNSDGSLVWSNRYGGSGTVTRFWTAGLDLNGDVLVSGDFPSQTDLGGGSIIGTSYGYDAFVAKFAGQDGSYRWATPIHGVGASLINNIGKLATDNLGNVILTGGFQGTYNFGNSSLKSPAGQGEGYIAKYNGSGVPIWAKAYLTTGTAAGTSVSTDSNNNVIGTGYFSVSVNIAGQVLNGLLGYDGVFFKLNP
jgi:hypothetical protein